VVLVGVEDRVDDEELPGAGLPVQGTDVVQDQFRGPSPDAGSLEGWVGAVEAPVGTAPGGLDAEGTVCPGGGEDSAERGREADRAEVVQSADGYSFLPRFLPEKELDSRFAVAGDAGICFHEVEKLSRED